jgi:uncharacterized membrane protein YccC
MVIVTCNPCLRERASMARDQRQWDLDMTSITRALARWRYFHDGSHRWRSIEAKVRAAVAASPPALLCGLRLSASVSLALYVAFWLQLDNPYWAGASAAAVCQPTLGASFRKGWYRMIGTVLGASVILVITGCFVQSRVAFLVCIALWGAVCATLSTLLRNFASYGAALASTTAIIIGCDTLGVTGGPDGQTFILAVTRAAEICIGIVCAGFILAATDFGGARRRLATQFAALLSDIQGGLARTLNTPAVRPESLQSIRRALVGRVVALDPIVEQTIGESSEIRYRSAVLAQASEGLIDALVGWQAIANHVVRLPLELANERTRAVRQLVPRDLAAMEQCDAPTLSSLSSPGLHRAVQQAVRRLISTPTPIPSLRLLLDQTAMALAGLSRTLVGLALLVADLRNPVSRRDHARPYIADWLPSLINGGRAFVTIGAAEILWIVTAWPTGTTCIIWAAIAVVLFGPKSDLAYQSAAGYCAGAVIAAVCAAVIKFAVLPQCESFACLCATFACYLTPVGALSSRGRLPALFGVMAPSFVALVSPANVMVYDTAAFYNAALGLVAGAALAALAFLLLPPLSPAIRTRRLLASTLCDLRRIAAGHGPRSPREWRRRMYARLIALPNSAGPLERAQLTAAVTAGAALIHLHRAARTLPIGARLQSAFTALSEGRCTFAAEALAWVDRDLASRPLQGSSLKRAIRARASVLALTEILDQHAAYFCAGAPQ